MPAPDNLQVQTPGQPLTQPSTEQTTTEAKEPEYTAKHNGGGRQRIWSASTNDWFSDFVAIGEGAKEAAQAEAERLNAGGEPFTKPADPAPEPTPEAKPQPSAEQAPARAQRQQAVLTDEGWLVPDLPAAYSKE
ncbi:hypothetical protein N5D52_19295 [Pseudomonas sp. GD03860]|uniref:hypothetical protein n=1 Tax=Pseudomonas sp. GD03860 TaxID=2975389 RepID=UPI00244AE8A0|nr:hypothetical protein [Pseudomonas sp. GD03860]MDH0639085.1 hypothetical protein [Pseudomonas sp. GD03860]